MIKFQGYVSGLVVIVIWVILLEGLNDFGEIFVQWQAVQALLRTTGTLLRYAFNIVPKRYLKCTNIFEIKM